MSLQQRVQAAGAEEKDKLTNEVRTQQRKLEDDEQKIRKEIDTESAKALESLYSEISAEIEYVRDRPVKEWKHEPYTLNSWGPAIMRI